MRRSYLILVWFLVLALFAGGLSCASPAPAPGTEMIVIDAIGYKNRGGWDIDMWLDLVDRINERAKGELFIDFRGGPEIITEKDLTEAVRAGVIDTVFIPSTRFKGQLPEGAALGNGPLTPWGEREGGFFDFMNEKLNAVSLHMWARTPQSWAYMGTNVKIDRPPELKGLKIRSTSTYNAAVRALGGSIVSIPSKELYIAVQTGVVDAYVVSITFQADASLHEVTDYLIDHPIYKANSNLIAMMNLDAWNGIPKHLQDLINTTAAEAERENWTKSEDLAMQARKVVLDAGVVPIKFSPEEAKWWTDLAYSAYQEEMKGNISPESYDKLMKFFGQ